VPYNNITLGLTSKNNISYNLQYDPTTGDGRIIQQNAPPGTKPIYENGKWNSSATSLGFNTSEQTQLHQQSIVSIQKAYNSIGGVNSGAKLGQWASANFTSGQPGQTSVNPAPSISGGGGVGPQGLATTVDEVLKDQGQSLKNIAQNNDYFGVRNEGTLYAGGMKYPQDLMVDQQDIFVISQFEYLPTKGSSLFGETVNINGAILSVSAFNTLNYGLQVGSPIGYQRPIGTVFLPMPNSVADNNSVGWGDDSMGNIAAAVAAQTLADPGGTTGNAVVGGAIGALFGNAAGGAGAGMLIGNLDKILAQGGASTELKALLGPEVVSKLLKLQGLGVPTESILARGAGIIPNSNMELLFQSPSLRKFSFTYRLSPRSAEEAKMVRRIIRFFKQGMAARKKTGKAGAGSFFLGTPNVFQLEYRSRGEAIPGVNKFKTCALTSFSCNFTPDGLWAAYQNGQPVSTIISMNFDELEPIYDTDYQENVLLSRTDLSAVDSNSIGY
jgi:hypothetical protein